MTTPRSAGDKSAPWAIAVQKILDDNNLRQNELAELIGMSKSAVGHWACGRVKPKRPAIDIMCEMFGLSPKQFFMRDLLTIDGDEHDAEPEIETKAVIDARHDVVKRMIKNLNDLHAEGGISFVIKADGTIGARIFQDV